MSPPIQKLAVKTTSLPIQKLAAGNYIAIDSEIGSDGGVILALLLFFLCLHARPVFS